MLSRTVSAGGFLGALLSAAVPLTAQSRHDDDRAAALAVAAAALEAISREDMVAFTDLMIEEAQSISIAVREGVTRYRVASRADSRVQRIRVDVIERGFDATVHLSGPMAVVWLPYDLYLDGNWSHCGVDTFTLVRTEAGWRIAALVWTVEQPPACRKHPDGPPSMPSAGSS